MNQDWEKWGRDISDLVQNAVDSQDFRRLNQSINRTIRDAADSIQRGMRAAGCNMDDYKVLKERWDDGRKETGQRAAAPPVQTYKRELFARKASTRAGGMALAICGGIIGGGLGLAILICIIVMALTGIFPIGIKIALAVMFPLFAGSLWMAFKGRSMVAEVKRFRSYVENLRGRTYCNLQDLAKATGQTYKCVLKDARKMIARGWFKEGHLDHQNTCLIVSHDTYREYEEIERQRKEQELLIQEQKRQREAQQMTEAARTEADLVIEEGQAYIRKIRACNDAIPGEEISRKISRMETVVRRIFERVEQNPEMIEDIHKLMVYYLPTTVKLLDAYIQLDSQPVDGENIRASKGEIEKTLDTINTAFEKLLDSLFEDVAWDVASDISVLQTMLVQEGLTGGDFKREE